MTTAVRQRDRDESPRIEAALEVLSDEYACRILVALEDGPKPAVDLADECAVSRPTVYRRLDRLETAGLVRSHARTDPDGNARRYFRLAVAEVRFEITERGIDGRLSLARPLRWSSTTDGSDGRQG